MMQDAASHNSAYYKYLETVHTIVSLLAIVDYGSLYLTKSTKAQGLLPVTGRSFISDSRNKCHNPRW